MNNSIYDLNTMRFEITFKSYNELRSRLSFYQRNNLYNLNIPCKNTIKKDFLLNSIKISRKEFPILDIIPHFSILHEFRRNSINTKNYFYEFVEVIKKLGCKQVLLISGSQKRATLDSVSTLNSVKDQNLFNDNNFSIGVSFNPYLPSSIFDEEITRLKIKLQSGLVSSIWIQFGTDIPILESRLELLKNTIERTIEKNSKILDINLFGSILIPSKQFLARFKYRPWKGVYCSSEFLNSLEVANNLVVKLFKTYRYNDINPIVETNISTEKELNSLIDFYNYN